MRVTALSDCCEPVDADCGVVVSDGFISVVLTQENEAAASITVKNAADRVCTYDPGCDSLLNLTAKITLCQVNPEMLNIMTGQELVLDFAGNAVGTRRSSNLNCNKRFALEVWSQVPGTACINYLSSESQTVTEGGSGLTSFTLTFDAQTTGSIAAAATAATVQTALEALSNIAPGDILVTGANGGPYTVAFLPGGAYGGVDVTQMTATPTGGTGTVTVATLIPGGVSTSAKQYGYFLVPCLRSAIISGDITLDGANAVSLELTAKTTIPSLWGTGPFDVVPVDTLLTPGPLLAAIGPKDHDHIQLTTVTPPAVPDDCGCVPLVIA